MSFLGGNGRIDWDGRIWYTVKERETLTGGREQDDTKRGEYRCVGEDRVPPRVAE